MLFPYPFSGREAAMAIVKSFLTGAIVTILLVQPVFSRETSIVYLSGTGKDDAVPWEFYCTEGRKSGEWTTLPVPSNWEFHGFGSYNYGHDKDKASEQGRYRLRFTVPADWKDDAVVIVFEGVMTDTEVRINGRSAGPVHQGGFYRFSYDISELLAFGQDNLLEVTVSKQSEDPTVNAAEREADYWVFGGIYRPVYLAAYPASFIERMAIDARADGALAADIFLSGKGQGDRLEAIIQDLDGKAAAPGRFFDVAPGQDEVRIQLNFENVRQWTAETPHLYRLEVRLMDGSATLHRSVEAFGFRTVELRPGDGIYINGRKVLLKGVNRHSFWPDSGRTTSRGISDLDVRLIKEMNMNAVRMSHYPPDKHFLEACDREGLYVLNELAGWQAAYGTEVGRKLVRELVTRDVNHPSIIFWNNGNEGGWNTELDEDFHEYDPQKRRVLHPWQQFNQTDTKHYAPYGCCPGELFQGEEVFFPTEFLHGLYDGGGGAGLHDYWNLILSRPHGAGGFLWALLDEGVVRTDREGIIDTDGNHAPDGILGPYREKEGSFHTIREIWSPVFIEPAGEFDGLVRLENRYDFTDLDQCRFEWALVDFPGPFDRTQDHVEMAAGAVTIASVPPGSSALLDLGLPLDWARRDALLLTALDSQGRELNTWSWMLKTPAQLTSRVIPESVQKASGVEDGADFLLRAGQNEIRIAKESGLLKTIRRSGRVYSLTNGPNPVTGQSTLSRVRHYPDGDAYVVDAAYDGTLQSVKWTLRGDGWLKMDFEYALEGEVDFLGVSFDYPEELVLGMKWLGKGPFRVWKNRMKGGTHGVWKKEYNDTKTGATWDYPEFKGYHAGLYWAVLETREGPLTLCTENQDLFLGVFTPAFSDKPMNATAAFPPGDISFLHGITPIGTKFRKPHELGPQGQRHQAAGRYKGTIYFHFGEPEREPSK
jgi:hypothetical protein